MTDIQDDDNSVNKKNRMEEKRFCVYLHKNASGRVLYVGEGTLDRAYSKSRKDQPTWQSIFGDNSPVVEIVAKDLTKRQAEDLETQVRKFYQDSIINDPYANKRVKDINFGYISQFVYYDESSPTCLRWKIDRNNNVKAGNIAGHLSSRKKYISVEINEESYLIHRIVWVLMNGSLSTSDVVDHIDGNSTNNRVSNLRITDHSGNSHNRIIDIPESGYRNIRSVHNKGIISTFIVRWTTLDNPKRLCKSFSCSKFGNADNALKEAYLFRDSLIQQGFLPSRIKEGEKPIE